MKACKLYFIFVLACLLTFFVSCSTANNTRFSRFYQSSVTKYNTYFNGYEAFKQGYATQEKSIKDNYIDLLLLLPVSDEQARSNGKEDFDLAIEKAQKCVKLYSISAKPKKKKGGSLSEKEKRFLEKNEYNPFLWKAWMLMADAQMQKGEFFEAIGTYSYICNLYFDEPEIIAEARIKTILCYSELGWNYETEELISRILTDPIPPRLFSEFNSVIASHLIKQERLKESLPYMEKGMKRPELSKTGKIREKYLLGQLYKATGQNEKAYKTFQEVIRMNPPYRIEFNARIQQTETMPETNQSKLFKKLYKMGKDPNNKEYQDQIYYAIGNIYLSKKDTVNALINYETGVEKGTRNGAEKGILLLTMANLYWEKNDYANAGRCYSKAIGLIDQKNEQYETVKKRSQVLEDLAIHNDNILLQDSLQWLATIDSVKLDTIIGSIIEKVIQSEKEAALVEKSTDEIATPELISSEGDNSDWYFYNNTLVENGKKAFVEHWGRRKLDDDWRRMNKTTLSPENISTENPAVSDSISGELLTDNDSIQDELVTDVHKKEYYLQQIPFTREQKYASDKIITDALFNAGIIYKDILEEYESAEHSFNRIVKQYPEADEAADALYNLYLMYSLWGKNDLADSSKTLMSNLFPDNERTLAICDSNFIENAKYGKHREDSLYAETYDAYKAGNIELVIKNCNISAEKYPLGYHRAKFLFLQAYCVLQEGNTSEFLNLLRLIVEKYPQNEISQLAGLIVQGVQDGKNLQSKSFTSIWEQRNLTGQVENIPDSVKPSFTEDRYQPYLFILAYPKDSINENRLLFEIAKYNFTNFMVRNFDIGFSEHQGIGMMTISEFMNYDEAYFYQQKIFGDNEIADKIQGLKSVIITKENLEILLAFYSFQDYQEFYEKHFLTIPDIDGSTIFEDMDNYE